MISTKGGNAPWATVDLDYGMSYLEKKQILRKPLYCTWELNTYSSEQTTDLLRVSVVVGKLYLGLIHSFLFLYTVKNNVSTVKSTNVMN